MQATLAIIRSCIPLAAALTIAVLAGMALAPRPAEAVGGLTLDDRISLAGEPIIHSNDPCVHPELPAFVVPEGRRLFIDNAQWDLREYPPEIRIANRIVIWRAGTVDAARGHGVFQRPMVLRAGETASLSAYDANGEPIVWPANGRCRFNIREGHLL